jgi:hypothetical protein
LLIRAERETERESERETERRVRDSRTLDKFQSFGRIDAAFWGKKTRISLV